MRKLMLLSRAMLRVLHVSPTDTRMQVQQIRPAEHAHAWTGAQAWGRRVGGCAGGAVGIPPCAVRAAPSPSDALRRPLRRHPQARGLREYRSS